MVLPFSYSNQNSDIFNSLFPLTSSLPIYFQLISSVSLSHVFWKCPLIQTFIVTALGQGFSTPQLNFYSNHQTGFPTSSFFFLQIIFQNASKMIFLHSNLIMLLFQVKYFYSFQPSTEIQIPSRGIQRPLAHFSSHMFS